MSPIMGRVSGRRVSARDAGWSAVEFFRVLGPLPAVPVDALRHALITLHAQRPTSRLLCRLDRHGGRWLPLSAAAFRTWADELIIEGDPGWDADAWARRLNTVVLGDRPMVLAAGGRFGGLRATHAVGDARVTEALLAEVLTAVTTGRAATHPFPRPARLPLTRALIHQLVSHPRQAPAAVRVRRPRASPATGPVTGNPDQAVAYASAVSAPGALAKVRTWRDAHAPGIPVSAVVFSAIYGAVRRHIGEPDPAGFVLVVDGRRYLPAGLEVEGNFAWGEHLRPASPEDPASVAAAVTELVQSRRTLTMLGLHNMWSLLTRLGSPPLPPPGTPRAAGPSPHRRPHLTLTYLGRNDRFSSLPRPPHEEARMIGVVTPSGPSGITVAVDERDGAMHLTASYHPGMFDPRRVAAATEAVARDAVGVVDETIAATTVPSDAGNGAGT